MGIIFMGDQSPLVAIGKLYTAPAAGAPLVLDKNGGVYAAADTTGEKPLFYVSPLGQLRSKKMDFDTMGRNLFQDEAYYLVLEVPAQGIASNTLLPNLQQVEERYAQKCALAPELRARFSERGAGSRIVILDLAKSVAHAKQVQSVINHPVRGVAPDAETTVNILALPDTTLRFEDLTPNEAGLRTILDAHATQSLDLASKALEDVLASPHLPDSVVLPFGSSIAKMSQSLATLLPYLEETKHPWGNMIKSIDSPRSEPMCHEKLSRAFIRQHLSQSTAFETSLQRYQKAVKTLTDKNTAVIVSAGNVNLGLPNYAPSDFFFFTACAPEAIVVGASNNQGTPKDVEDDKISALTPAPLTLKGQTYQVDYLFPGRYIQVSESSHRTEVSEIVHGTSFSAPALAGLLALSKGERQKVSLEGELRALDSASVTVDTHSNSSSSASSVSRVVNPFRYLQKVTR